MSHGTRVVGIVSMGAMGAGVARVLVNAGDRVVTTTAGRSRRTADAASAAGAVDVGTVTDVVAQSDVVLSLVPPDAAVSFARDVADAMTATGRSPLFVDGNSIAPPTLGLVEEAARRAGARVLDLSIIGLPPAAMAPGEMSAAQFYVAGPDAEVLASYRDHELDVRVIDAPPGAAKALKMCYAGISKGIIGLVLDMFMAARRMGVSAELIAQMNATQREVLAQVARQAKGFAPKAYRWVGEMHEMEKTFAPLDLPVGFFEAAGDVFARLAATELGRPSDELPAAIDLDMILDRLERGMVARPVRMSS